MQLLPRPPLTRAASSLIFSQQASFLTEVWKVASSTAGGGNDADCYHRDGRAGHHLRDAFHCADSIVGTAVPACHGAVWPALIPRMVHVRRYRVEAWWSLSGVSSFVGRGTLP